MSVLLADGDTHTPNFTIKYYGAVGRQLYSYTGPPAFQRWFTFSLYIVCTVEVGKTFLSTIYHVCVNYLINHYFRARHFLSLLKQSQRRHCVARLWWLLPEGVVNRQLSAWPWLVLWPLAILIYLWRHRAQRIWRPCSNLCLKDLMLWNMRWILLVCNKW